MIDLRGTVDALGRELQVTEVAIADELAAGNDRVHVLHRQEKDGLGRAYCAGFVWALEHDYDFVFEMDCDFSHNPDDIARFLEKAEVEDNAEEVPGVPVRKSARNLVDERPNLGRTRSGTVIKAKKTEDGKDKAERPSLGRTRSGTIIKAKKAEKAA